jgi:transposase
MPKRFDPAIKERALRMYADQRSGYASATACAEAVAVHLGIGRETMRRWVRQHQIDAGEKPGVTTKESEEIRQLKAENARLREDNEILRRASIFFAGELDPRNR